MASIYPEQTEVTGCALSRVKAYNHLIAVFQEKKCTPQIPNCNLKYEDIIPPRRFLDTKERLYAKGLA